MARGGSGWLGMTRDRRDGSGWLGIVHVTAARIAGDGQSPWTASRLRGRRESAFEVLQDGVLRALSRAASARMVRVEDAARFAARK
eukprot:6058484-Prymnesium_polylepis.1